MHTNKALWVLAATFCAHAAMAQMTCERVDSPSPVRAEGAAELVTDVVLRCSGGAAGSLPQYQIIVSSNVSFGNRTLGSIDSLNWAWNDALLIVDDPPADRQVACAPPPGALTCAATGNAVPNIFQGKLLQPNAIVFQGVPISAPGPSGTRTIRIANLRVNAAAASTAKDPQPVTLSVAMFTADGRDVTVNNASKISATWQKSMRFSVKALDGAVESSAYAPLTVTPSMLPQNSPKDDLSALVTFSELTPGAFRRRNAGTTAGDPNYLASQPIPGGRYNTETGFYNSALATTYRVNEAGLASTGTRLRTVIEGIPDGVAVWVSVRDVSKSGASTADPRALLTYTDNNGAGDFSYMHPWVPGWAQLYVDKGKTSAVWEVMSADPDALEDFTFAVSLTAASGTPSTGIIQVHGTLGPIAAGATPANPSFQDLNAADASLPLISIARTIAVPQLPLLSAASFTTAAVSADSIVAAFTPNLNRGPAAGSLSTTSLQGVTIDIIDSAARRSSAALLYLSPTQTNFIFDRTVRSGPAVVNLLVDGKLAASGSMLIDTVAPALFSSSGDGKGQPVGQVVRVGAADPAPLSRFDADSAKWVPVPFRLADGDLIYLTLWATGIRGRSSLSAVTATVGGATVPAIYAAPDPDLPGVDQLSVGPLPATLRGAGRTVISIKVDGRSSQELAIEIQ